MPTREPSPNSSPRDRRVAAAPVGPHRSTVPVVSGEADAIRRLDDPLDGRCRRGILLRAAGAESAVVTGARQRSATSTNEHGPADVAMRRDRAA